MKSTLILLVSAILLTGLGLADNAQAQDRVVLGERNVRSLMNSDTIHVGKIFGKFRGIQVSTSGSEIEFRQIVIYFDNGEKQTYRQGRALHTANVSPVISLDGGTRQIEKVVLQYQSRNSDFRGTSIRLFGLR